MDKKVKDVFDRLHLEKCFDNRYRRTYIHDNMSIEITEFRDIWVYAESDDSKTFICVTRFTFEDVDKFEKWFKLTK